MLPRCTDDLPACPGQARVEPGHTVLEERLWQAPDGGDHFWLKARLDGMANRQAQAAIARAAGVEAAQVRCAGPRDRHAVVTQWFTVAKELVENPGQLAGAGYKRQLKVLEVREGHGPISPGQVQDLSCRLRLQGGASDGGFERAQAICRVLRQLGCPNYLGAGLQGPGGSHARWGRLLARGKRLPARVPRSGADRRRYDQAWQARLFNAWVAARIQGPGLDTAVSGDLVRLHAHRPPSEQIDEIIVDPDAVAGRLQAFETAVLGPLFGGGMVAAEGAAYAIEQAVIDDLGPPPGERCRGGRRSLRFQPAGAEPEIHGADLIIACHIPVDAHAAILGEEFVHPEGHLP